MPLPQDRLKPPPNIEPTQRISDYFLSWTLIGQTSIQSDGRLHGHEDENIFSLVSNTLGEGSTKMQAWFPKPDISSLFGKFEAKISAYWKKKKKKDPTSF